MEGDWYSRYMDCGNLYCIKQSHPVGVNVPKVQMVPNVPRFKSSIGWATTETFETFEIFETSQTIVYAVTETGHHKFSRTFPVDHRHFIIYTITCKDIQGYQPES